MALGCQNLQDCFVLGHCRFIDGLHRRRKRRIQQHKFGRQTLLLLGMIKDQRPILDGDLTLLRDRPGNVTDDIHAPPGGPGTRNESGPTQCLVAGGGRNVVGTDVEVVHLVGKDGLQKNEHAIVPGTVFIYRQAQGTFFGETDRVLVTLLDFFPRSQNRFCHAACKEKETPKK
jgi:hypothetical protein